MKAKHLILAGTFDHLHLGHQWYIKSALQQTESASCWLTTNWVNKNKAIPQAVQSFGKRLKSLSYFLSKNKLEPKVKIFPLNNHFGPTLSQPKIDAIACTAKTLSTCNLINQKRKTNKLKPLSIFKIKLVKAKDKKRISSTRIRSGQIDRQGLVYQQMLPQTKTLYLPQNQRHWFKKPLGSLIKGSEKNISWAGLKVFHRLNHKNYSLIISVGDISTQALVLNKIPLDLAIFDRRCQRRPINLNIHQRLKNKANFYHHIRNFPGTLSYSTLEVIKNSLSSLMNSRQGIIEVRGEEDLLVLPLVLLSPLKTLIFYGQPHQGLVQVEVTEGAKKKTLKLLQRFRS